MPSFGRDAAEIPRENPSTQDQRPCKAGVMLRSRVRARGLGLVVVAACLGFGAWAGAAGDDRGAAESALKEVAASPKKDVAAELVARSRAALDRGAQLRTKGDEAHARLA